MPKYVFYCPICEMPEWEIKMPMSEINGYKAICPACGGEGIQLILPPGMIKVKGGASPTRVGNSYARQHRPSDPGFKKEFESIFADAGMADPNTGERYEYTEQDETGAAKAILPSQVEKEKRLQEFHEHHLEYARQGLTKEFIAKTEGDIKSKRKKVK